ncbi:hypothetical protein ADUPG1_002939 [Aduncisulcus paluster]|uniref:Chromo domain-containing protein n=1 Tax=Aduncisulcus paluster TaxID=2918883 RepID=A0ABQ5KT23_9EUKA|nr:hypothetical protein ADUPG1_002939 [Aduncisulcus paluster]
MIEIRSLINDDNTLKVHIKRIVPVKGEHEMKELREIAANGDEEYLVDCIVDHRGETRDNSEFLVQWVGYDPQENTWEPLSSIRDTVALDKYLEDHEELNGIVG